MSKEIICRTTKFPYIFWSFNKAYKCEIDVENEKYRNLEAKTEYGLKKFSFTMFLILKYLPISVIIFFCFSKYDFNFNKVMLVSYSFAIMLLLTFAFLDNLAKKIAIISILGASFVIGYWFIDVYILPAYVLKYFIFLMIIFGLFLDISFQPYSLLKGEKVVSHILIPKGVKL